MCSRGIIPPPQPPLAEGEGEGEGKEAAAKAEQAKVEEGRRALRKKRAAESKASQGPPKSKSEGKW